MSAAHYNDQPIQEPKEDLFGIDPFAQALARSVLKMSSPVGSVIALNGPWGSGKSSVVNLVLHHLQEAVDKGDLKIIRFNCWWFRGEEALALAFFRDLYAGIGPSLSKRFKKLMPKLGAQLLRTGSIIEAAAETMGAGGLGKIASGSMGWLGSLISQDESVEGLHAELSRMLAEQKKRFLVIIDDIDRLSPEEALLIFRLVKSVGRLPNVMYLLVYDRPLAEKIVSERFPSEGPHYLEKIVQASFEIPEPQQEDLHRQLLSHIEAVCGHPGDSNIVRFMNLFNDIVAHEIKAPRDATRLGYTLTVTWPSIAGQVDIGDFVALEALRLFQPQLYRALRQNKLLLCEKGVNYYASSRDQAAKYDEVFLTSIPEAARARYKRGLYRLFPHLESIWSNVHYSSTDEWERQRRVCSKSHFDSYFRFSISPDAVPQQEIDELIRRAEDRPFIRSKLQAALQVKRKSGGTKSALLLEGMTLHAQDIPLEKARPLLETVFALADELHTDADLAGAFSVGSNELRIHWLLRKLTLDRTSLPQRSAIFMAACRQASLGWIVDFTSSAYSGYHPREGREPETEENCLVTRADLDELVPMALEKIRTSAADDSLLQCRGLHSILFRWREFANDGGAEARVWTSSKLDNDEMVAHFAKIFTSHSWTHTMSDTVTRRTVRAAVSGLDDIIDRTRFRQRLEEIETRDGDACPEVIKTFLDAWRRQETSGRDC
ncbi:MAG: P-loop NTPase fold protein [Alphaproteobacteria bacterium]